MSIQEPDNPFQSPATVSHVIDAEPQQDQHEHDDVGMATAKATLRWSLICGISAIPSWILANGTSPEIVTGMATGIFIFVIGYTILDVATRKHPLRQKREVKTTLTITYGTRMAISILFPVGFFVDIFCGIFAVGATEFLYETVSLEEAGRGFTSTLITTLIQGCLLNLVLAGYGILVYLLCRAFMSNRSTSTS